MSKWTLDDGRVLDLLTPEALATLPNGTRLLDVMGEEAVVGRDKIDSDTRFGYLSYGIESKPEGSVTALREALRESQQDSGRLRAGIRRIINEEWDDLDPDDRLHLRSARDFARGLLHD